jgi:hypothetical protein
MQYVSYESDDKWKQYFDQKTWRFKEEEGDLGSDELYIPLRREIVWPAQELSASQK